VVVGEELPDRGGGDSGGPASIIASMWRCRPLRAAGSRWIFFLAGGSAESRALMMARRPTWCLRLIGRHAVTVQMLKELTAQYSQHILGSPQGRSWPPPRAG
jgi:hypothetical protein